MSDLAACPACGGDANPEAARERVRTARGSVVAYARCPRCGLLRMDPLPGPSELATWYDADYYGRGESKFAGGIERFRSLCMRRRARRVAAKLARPSGRILDVGCGDGRFLDGMRRLGYEIVGVERDGSAGERAARIPGLCLYREDFTRAELPAAGFDAITLWHVLEHLSDPLAALRCCRTLLRDDGLLVVEVPNLDSLQSRTAGVRAFHLDPPRHLCQFTASALDQMVRRAGFVAVKRETGSLEMGVFGAAQGWLNRLIEPRDLLFDMLRTRNRCPGTGFAKLFSVVLGAVFMPWALLFTCLETVCGRGPVLRYFCRLR